MFGVTFWVCKCSSMARKMEQGERCALREIASRLTVERANLNQRLMRMKSDMEVRAKVHEYV